MFHKRSWWLKFIVLALVLALIVPILVACGGGNGSDQEATPSLLPPDWNYHTADKLQIGLPKDWIVAEGSTEGFAQAIDNMIQQFGDYNPELTPYLAAAKANKLIRLFALELPAVPGSAVNLNVGCENSLFPLEQYALLVKSQVEQVGGTVAIGERLNVRGHEAVRLECSLSVQGPSGEVQFEEQMVIIDHSADRYLVTLAYLPKDAQKYQELFDEIIQTLYFTK